MTDLIDRQAALDALEKIDYSDGVGISSLKCDAVDDAVTAIKVLPSAQPNLSEAYSKAVFTWLMDYQIRTAELNGRYTPYEVLSWVINDWRKENG